MVTKNPIAISGKAKKATGSIAHAAEILICLSNDIHKVSDIARQCNFSKSTVHRVLKLLEQSQLVVQDTINRRYYISLLITKLASNAITTHKRLIMYADAEMQRLSSISEETVALDIMSGMQYLPLHEIPSQHNLRVTQESKRIGPLYAGLYAGASVKVLLAQLDENRLKMLLDIIKITPVTERTVTDKELLLAQLKDICKKGYAVSRGERVPGTICVAVPIPGYILPVGLSVVGPEIRLQSKIKEVIAELKASSSRISHNIEGIFGERG
jgi:IclR family acetate operon transcriptional repressor